MTCIDNKSASFLVSCKETKYFISKQVHRDRILFHTYRLYANTRIVIPMTTFHPLTPQKCAPPGGSISPNGIYWRFVFHDSIVSSDFLIWILEPENSHLLEERTKKNHCDSFAVSLVTDEGIKRKLNVFMFPMRRKAERKKASFLGLAKVELNGDLGVLKQKGKDPHVNFWPYVTCKLEDHVTELKGI